MLREAITGFYKNEPIEALDAYFGNSDPDELRRIYENALAVAEQFEDGSIADVTAHFRTHGDGPDDVGTADHVEDHWVAANSFLGQKQADRIVRRGYVEAIRVALSHEPPLPIETLWAHGMSDDFEFHICEGPRQVTVLQFIPREDGRGAAAAPAAGRPSTARTWVVRVGSADESGAELLDDAGPSIVKHQTSGRRGGTGATAD